MIQSRVEVPKISQALKNAFQSPSYYDAQSAWARSEASQIMRESLDKTFREGQVGGWKSLAKSTQETRRRIASKHGGSFGPSAPILKRFGGLKEGVVGMRPLVRNFSYGMRIEYGAEAIKDSGKANEKKTHGGTLLEKYKYNQKERVMVKFRDEDLPALTKSYSNWIERRVNNAMEGL